MRCLLCGEPVWRAVVEPGSRTLEIKHAPQGASHWVQFQSAHQAAEWLVGQAPKPPPGTEMEDSDG